MVPSDRTIPQRLLEGARTLGRLWREDKCVSAGWSVKRTADGKDFEPCPCEPKHRFCKAKLQWLKLAASEPREIPITEGDAGIPFSMLGAEWDATGCTLHWELEGVGKLKVGAKSGISMGLLRELLKDPQSAVAAMKLMIKFPNSKMEFEEAPKVEAPV